MILRISLLLLALLAGCATSDQGRARLVAPEGVGAVYSDVDLRTQLALTEARDCGEDDCKARDAFRHRVAENGQRLARAAYAAYPGLESRIPNFEFAVPDKAQVGTMSNSGGSVMILGGLSELAMDDAALDFVIAREMGHVIGRHHDENTALSIMVSVAVQILFPVANVIRGAAAALPMATTTAASMVGSRVIKAANRPDQLDEADAIAVKLLRQSGRDLDNVADAVNLLMPQLMRLGGEGWIAELKVSKGRLDQFDCGLAWASPPDIALTPAAGIATVAELSTQ